MLAARASKPRKRTATAMQMMQHLAWKVQEELLLRAYTALRALACLLATLAARTWIARSARAAVVASNGVGKIDVDPKEEIATLLPPPLPENRGKLTVRNRTCNLGCLARAVEDSEPTRGTY